MQSKRIAKSASKAQKSTKSIGHVNYSYCSQPCPDEMRVTLRYTDTYDATASAGIASYQLGLNDVYDPDISGLGSQPAYYDEWSALYLRWVVTECEYDVGITSRTVSGRLSVAVAPVNGTSLVPATFEEASSLRYAKVAETTGGGPTYHIRGKVNVAKLYGMPDYAVESDDAFAGSATSSPGRRLVLAIVAQTSGSSDALSWTVVMKYRVRFLQPKVSALSLTSRVPAATAARAPHFSTFTSGGPRQVEHVLPEDGPCPREKDDHTCSCGCRRT